MDRRFVGRAGELVALFWYLAHGYRLRHRNWRGPSGELDLVVGRRGEIVIVEVKARSSADFGGGAAAVDSRKREALARTAAAYLSRFDLWDRPCRFDVLVVERSKRGGLPTIRHFANAFRPDLGRRL